MNASEVLAAMLILSSLGMIAPPAVIHAQTPNDGKSVPKTDDFGDPLPQDAVARIGTARWRHGDRLCSLALSANGKILASGANDRHRSIRVWNAVSGKPLHRIDNGDSFVAIAPDGTTLATSGKAKDRHVRLWDLGTGKQLRQILVTGTAKQPVHGLMGMAFSPDGNYLAVAGWYQMGSGNGGNNQIMNLHLVDLRTRKVVRSVSIPDAVGYGILQFVFAPNGRTLAVVGGQKQTVYLWEVATGQIRVALGHAVVSCAYSPDGRTLAIADPKSIRLVDALTRKTIRTLRGFPGHAGTGSGPGPIALGPDGRLLAAGGGYADANLRIWDVKTGQLLRTIPTLTNHVPIAVAFAPNGRTLASASWDSTVLFWDVSNIR